MKVLIVDDSVVVRSRLIEMVSEVKGLEIVGQAQDVNEALDFFRQKGPDVVILDIRMTGGSGIDVLKYIKRVNRSVKVIMLTNYPFPQYRKKCEEFGADFFFDKSKDAFKVVETLNALMLKQDTGLSSSPSA
jgi:DNA-binding NarL/FixJ family response regulator